MAAFDPRAHAPDVSRITPSVGAQAARDEAICVLGRNYVSACRTLARDNASRLAANRTYGAGWVETKYIEDVPEIETNGLHIDCRLAEGNTTFWYVLRSDS